MSTETANVDKVSDEVGRVSVSGILSVNPPPPEPATFDFTVSSLTVKNPRSLWEDTDYATLAISVLTADNTIIEQYGPISQSFGGLGKNLTINPNIFDRDRCSRWRIDCHFVYRCKQGWVGLGQRGHQRFRARRVGRSWGIGCGLNRWPHYRYAGGDRDHGGCDNIHGFGKSSLSNRRERRYYCRFGGPQHTICPL
jgi:hypothetical protein